MSIESLTIALHHSKATGATKLVLLGIANHDGDGGAWPAVATLARYAGGVDRSTVKRAIDKLEQLGEVRRIINGGGNQSTAEYQRPNLYKFLLQCPSDCDRTSQHRTTRRKVIISELDGIGPASMEGGAPARRGGTDAPGGGRTSAPLTVPLTQPPVKEQNPAYRARGTETCAKGHELIDDRHCILGCAPAELVTT